MVRSVLNGSSYTRKDTIIMKNPEIFSIWSSYDVDLTPEDMVLAMERRGLTVCELSDEHAAELLKREGTPAEIGAAFGAYAKEHNLTFPQGHLWLAVRLCSKEVDAVAILKQWFELFAAIGIKNAVLHCDTRSFAEDVTHEEVIAANAEKLKPLAAYAEELGLCICLENLGGHFAHLSDLLDVIGRVNSPALGICLDTGHLHIHEKEMTQEEFILGAGKLLHALHIADNDTSGDQHLMPYGRGTVDWNAVMRGLNAIGYCDCFNYEIPGERRLPMPVRDAKAEYLKTVTAYLFSL